MNTKKSVSLFERSKALMPGGVNSPVRSFKSVGGTPRFMVKGEGAYVIDADGNKYVDFTASWGPLIHGHAHPHVNQAIEEALRNGTSFGTPTERELILAEQVINAVPAIEKVRFVNSGTEATMSAVRLARAFTGREKVVKFEGCYHGHADLFLSQAGSGLATLGQPTSPGVPAHVVASTITIPYNDLEAVQAVFESHADDIAAVILEPVAGNMGVIVPSEGFLPGLRQWTEDHQSLLIFDEVITGFRLARGGAQERFGIRPDLTTLGKIIGGGMPVGAYGGRAELMDMVAPEGPVYQAGTLSGNPIAMAAGAATLELLAEKVVYEKLESLGQQFSDGLKSAARRTGIDLCVNTCGSMVSLFFTSDEVQNFNDVFNSQTKMFAPLHHDLMERGIYLPPSAFETFFISTVHTEEHIQIVLEAFELAFSNLKM